MENIKQVYRDTFATHRGLRIANFARSVKEIQLVKIAYSIERYDVLPTINIVLQD